MSDTCSPIYDGPVLWAVVEEFPDYEVSCAGSVRCCRKRRYLNPGDLISLHRSQSGYVYVSLNKKNRFVHRLVCRAFNGPPPSPLHEVAHNNGQRADNRHTNLRWALHKDNCSDIKAHGTENPPRGEKQGISVLTEPDVVEIRRLRKLGHTQPVLAKKFGVARTTINAVCNKYSWKHVA